MKTNICPSRFRLVSAPEIVPADRAIGERIYESIVSHVPLEQSGVPIFDELPDQPTKNMKFDPENSPRLDPLDRAQRVIDYYGDKVDSIRVSRDIAAAQAAGTEPPRDIDEPDE